MSGVSGNLELETVRNVLKSLVAGGVVQGATLKKIEKCLAGREPAHKAESGLQDRILKPQEVASMLGLSRRSVDNLARQGCLRKVKLFGGHARRDGRVIGGRCGFPLSSVREYLNSL